MKVQYCSDLHLEFRENLGFIQTLPLAATGDVLVIAGDVAYLNDTTIPNIQFWKWASKNYRQVLMVAGNHEFYHNGDIATHGDSWERMFHPNVGYYHNKVVHIDDTDFILSTLWSRIPPIVVATHHLPTFAAIEDRYKGNVLNVAFATELGDYIANSQINAWIYGHAHHRTDFYIGNTHMVSNPLGYIFAGEGAAFDETAMMDV